MASSRSLTQPSLVELIPAMVGYVVDRGGVVTKTKLLKLLYLFDIEYYRRHRQTFSGLPWKFFHLGPWAKEFDPLLVELVDAGVLTETRGSHAEVGTNFYRAAGIHEIDALLKDPKDACALRRVLDLWCDSTTGEILDYVYFRTEPMESAVRNQPLDFRAVKEEPAERYKRSSSGKATKKIGRLRGEVPGVRGCVMRPLERSTPDPPRRFTFTPPRYDDEFFEAIDKLDTSRR